MAIHRLDAYTLVLKLLEMRGGQDEEALLDLLNNSIDYNVFAGILEGIDA